MTTEAQDSAAPALRRHRAEARARLFRRGVASRFSSSLTRRIVVLNLGGLFVLLLGVLYLNQFQAGLIDARVQSLQTQGEIIAAAIAASATVDTNAITLDPDKLLQLVPGESESSDTPSSLEFSINPESVGPVLRLLVSPTQTRARIYDRDGFLLVDSVALAARGNILRSNLPAVEEASFFERIWSRIRRAFGTGALPVSGEIASSNGRAYEEVARALDGSVQSIVRPNARGETIISVAVPIQRFRVVRGALLLSTQGGAIDAIIASERWAILRIFLVAAAVMFLLSLFLAGTIAEPMRRLAEASEQVARNQQQLQAVAAEKIREAKYRVDMTARVRVHGLDFGLNHEENTAQNGRSSALSVSGAAAGLGVLAGCCEIAFFSLTRTEIEDYRNTTSLVARTVTDLLHKPRYLLSTLLWFLETKSIHFEHQ